ncbi:MAG: DUF928 domain-containing protein [Cyanobacteria bacterium J06656_5]
MNIIGIMVRHYLAMGLLLIMALGPLGASSAMADVTDNTRESSPLLPDWSFWPTDDDKAPNRTVSGASRGSCSSEQVTPLLPGSQYGLTTQTHPEILFATSVETPRQGLFVIQSTQSDSYYYETYIELPATPRIISIALPSDAPALATNDLYQWSLILMCNDRLRPDSPALQGWIQTQPAASNTNVSLEQAIEYREAHVWYDMVSLLADLRTQHPNNPEIRQAWQRLLDGIDLTTMADTPIIE